MDSRAGLRIVYPTTARAGLLVREAMSPPPNPGLATELARLKVDVIVAGATPAGRAARAATATIPIIFMAMGDPVGDGLVASLARPGGNLTGTTFLGPALVPKHLALLKQALPRATRIAILWHPGAFADSTMREMLKEAEAAARTLRIQLRFAAMRRPDELEHAFSTITKEHPDALLVFPSTMLFAERTYRRARRETPAALSVQQQAGH